MQSTPGPVLRLIDELTKLPGIGPKTAQRLTFFLLRQPAEAARGLAEAMVDVKERIGFCSTCFNITETDPCAICADAARDRTVICVVEEPLDVLAIERTRGFRGLYHVLHGAINPLDGIGPDDLRIEQLIARVRTATPGVTEIVLATNPSLEGDNTAFYIDRKIKQLAGLPEQPETNGARPPVRVTRLGRGLPAGGDLEYADDITLMRALEARREL